MTLLLAVAGITNASAAANWVGNSAIYVNGTWYYAGNYFDWCTGGKFDGANLGTFVNSIPLAGQSQNYEDGDVNWNGGSVTMFYKIDGGEQQSISLPWQSYNSETHNNLFESKDEYGNFVITSVDISGLSAGSHTIEVYYYCDNAWDSNNSQNYKANFTVSAPTKTVNYIDENGETQSVEANVLANGSNTSDIDAGWYVVTSDAIFNYTLSFTGDTHLILADDAHLTISSDGSGMAVNESGIESNLTIYAQSTGNNKGKVTIEARTTGIWVWNGSLTINGGDIIANGYSSGIDITYGGIIINGGTINVSGTYYGISTTTYDDTPCDIIINGGEINATTDDEEGETAIYTKGKISINGGSVIANGSTNGIQSGKDISITGGNITATTKYGTGIYSDGDIIINSGTIITSGNSYGIATSSQDIYINGGDITATGDSYGGIKAKSITLGGGIVNAIATSGNHYGIGDESGTITLSGGTVTASSYNGTVKVAEGLNYTAGNNIYSSAAPFTNEQKENIAGETIKPSITGKEYESNYWTTFYTSSVGFTIDEAVNAYAYTAEVGTDNITLHLLGKVIPKQTAVIIVSESENITMSADAATNVSTVPENNLHGVDVATATDDITSELGQGTIFVLGKTTDNDEVLFGFHKYIGETMPARKAFLLINSNINSNNEALARGISVVFDDDSTTGIKAVNREERIMNSDDAWFDLQGRKIQEPTQRGLYIHNGKKIVVK